MAKIFLSYRRSDTSAVSGRIYDRLLEVLDAEEIFKDVDAIPLGSNFRTVITEKIEQSEIVLVLIGKDYTSVTNEDGSLRLFDEEDPVRIEVVTALASSAKVVPVLVEGAAMPKESELPEDMHELVVLNAASILSDPRFHSSCDSLIKSLGLQSKPAFMKWGSIGGTVLLAVVLIWFFLPPTEPDPDDPALKGNDAITTANVAADIGNAGSDTIPDVEITPYDPSFLGGGHVVELPTITASIASSAYKRGEVFDYPHFSLVMNQDRSMALFTAHNYDRSDVVRLDRDSKWYLDSRLPTAMQRDNELYIRNELDRGHLVPFSEVGWGDLARLNPDTCRKGVNAFSNTTPQHKDFNRGNWLILENHIRKNLEDTLDRLVIFTGPVFRSNDLEVRGTRIPQSYWKVVVTKNVNSSTRLKVQAFEVPHYVPDGFTPKFAQRFKGSDVDRWRIRMQALEAITGLDFGYLKQYDVMNMRGLSLPD